MLELDRVVPAVENHPFPRRMTEGQCPDIVIRLEEWHAATVLHILCVGPAQIGAVARHLSKGSGNLIQQRGELRGSAAFPRSQNRRINNHVRLTGLDGKVQLLEIPAMNLLSHSHIEVRASMMLLKPGTVYAGSREGRSAPFFLNSSATSRFNCRIQFSGNSAMHLWISLLEGGFSNFRREMRFGLAFR